MNGFHAKSTLTHTILQPCLWTNGKRYVVALVFRETLGRAAETPSKDTVGLDAFLSCVGPARSSHGLESNSRVLIYVVWRTHAHTHIRRAGQPLPQQQHRFQTQGTGHHALSQVQALSSLSVLICRCLLLYTPTVFAAAGACLPAVQQCPWVEE